jgi:hypothetical protein
LAIEQPDDLRMAGDAIGDPHERNGAVQDADQRETQYVAIKCNRAVKVGDAQHDFADTERPDRDCRWRLRHRSALFADKIERLRREAQTVMALHRHI